MMVATLKGGPQDGDEIVLPASQVVYFTAGPRKPPHMLADVGIYRLLEETMASEDKVQFVWEGWT